MISSKELLKYKPKKIKSIGEGEVLSYIFLSLKYKPMEVIISELNSLLEPGVPLIRKNDFWEIIENSLREDNIPIIEKLSKEEVKDWNCYYLLSKQRDLVGKKYVWLINHSNQIIDLLFDKTDKTAWDLSATIWVRYGRKMHASHIINYFNSLGLEIREGDKNSAFQKGGIDYKLAILTEERKLVKKDNKK